MSCSVRHVHAATVSALLLLGACAPVIESMRLTPVPFDPRPANYPVRIYSTTVPRCSYEEVAVLSAEEVDFMRHALRSDDTANRLRDRVRKLGGDAVIGLSETIEDHGVTATQTQSRTVSGDSTKAEATTRVSTEVAPNRTRRLEGTVVRFTREDCRN